MDDVVRAVGELSARWAARLPEGNTVLSGVGLWPLLAILSAAADEPGRSELAAAAGVEPETAAVRAVELIGVLDGAEDLRAALGVWVAEDLKLAESFGEVMPAPLRGTLTGDPARDEATLDGWVTEHTDGLIRKMPLTVTPDLVLALASALSLRTTWVKPFDERPDGRLSRSDADLSTVRVHGATPAGPLVTATVVGDADVDVRLGLGRPEAGAADVVPALLGAIDEPGTDGTRLLEITEPGTEVAPGLTVATSTARRPDVQLSLPSFEVRADHDLLERADLFGLAAVSSTPRGPGHFTRLSPERLQVSQARQTVYARFFATGFEAAAVTVTAMTRAAMVTPQTKQLRLVLDRPFAFAAVHRPTGLPIVAGWLANP
jgi:serine protease inhibitor